METLHNGYTLSLCQGAFPLSTDSIILSGFLRLPKNASVLDLGSGCGTLGLLLCANDETCKVTGVELDERAHLTALENSERNGLSHRLTSICGDLTAIPSMLPAGSFSCAVSNPPYFSAGPQSRTVPLARREDKCGIRELFAAAAWAVKYGGDFYLVHRPERLAEICTCASEVHFAPKRLCLVRHKEGSDVALILLQCRKGGKPGLKWEELCLHDREGRPTQAYNNLYHL